MNEIVFTSAPPVDCLGLRCSQIPCGCCQGCGLGPEEWCPECGGCGCADRQCDPRRHLNTDAIGGTR